MSIVECMAGAIIFAVAFVAALVLLAARRHAVRSDIQDAVWRNYENEER